MKTRHFMVLAIFALAPLHSVLAGIITAQTYADDTAFTTATGASSLTGPLTALGNVGTSVTLGDATLSATNNIYVDTGWSSLLPNQVAIAISGPENLGIMINTGLSNAFGFYMHEPTTSGPGLPDTCNFGTCVDSTFLIEFLLGGTVIDGGNYMPSDDVAEFYGFTLDMAFDSVRFTETIGSADNEYFGEMYARAIPEPGTLVLLGIGIAGIAFSRRNQRLT